MTDAKPSPSAAVCTGCRTSRPTRNGFLVCVRCDRMDLMPQGATRPFREPGE